VLKDAQSLSDYFWSNTIPWNDSDAFHLFGVRRPGALLIQLDLTQYSLKTKRRQDGAKGALQG
jgi:hypothetical protein